MKNGIKLFAISLLVCSITMIASGAFSAEKNMVFSFNGTNDSPGGKYLNMVYSEAFKRLGYTFTCKEYPAMRASMMSDMGEVDGELARIYQYQKDHPTVIRVETPHLSSGFLAVSLNSAIKLNGWKSLKNKDYVVTYTRGIHGCESNLPKFVKATKLITVDNSNLGIRSLCNHRADVYVDTEREIMAALNSDEFKNSGLQVVGVMEEFTGHAYLHKKHKELVPKLSAVLKDMQKEGLFTKYRSDAKLHTYFK